MGWWDMGLCRFPGDGRRFYLLLTAFWFSRGDLEFDELCVVGCGCFGIRSTVVVCATCEIVSGVWYIGLYSALWPCIN